MTCRGRRRLAAAPDLPHQIFGVRGVATQMQRVGVQRIQVRQGLLFKRVALATFLRRKELEHRDYPVLWPFGRLRVQLAANQEALA